MVEDKGVRAQVTQPLWTQLTETLLNSTRYLCPGSGRWHWLASLGLEYTYRITQESLGVRYEIGFHHFCSDAIGQYSVNLMAPPTSKSIWKGKRTSWHCRIETQKCAWPGPPTVPNQDRPKWSLDYLWCIRFALNIQKVMLNPTEVGNHSWKLLYSTKSLTSWKASFNK